MESLALDLVLGARLLVAGAFVLSLAVFLTHLGVRRGSVSAFGGWARWVRSWSDPLLRPLERRLVRSGANPQDAPAWLVGVAVVGGLVVLGMLDWLIGFLFTLYQSARAGALLITVIHTVFQLLELAIMVRVMSSWIGLSPHSKFMRFIHALTDWLVEPLRRVIPPLGMIDISPMVAYFVLYLAERLVMRGLF